MEYGRDPEFNPYRAPDHFEGPLSEVGPEKRYVQFAGFWIRFCARLIDQLIVGVVLMIVFFVSGVVLVAINGGQMPNPADDTFAIFILAYLAFLGLCFATPVVYYTLLEGSSWQASLGKLAVGIKVVDEHGYRISYGRALGRNLGKILSELIFSIGFLIAAFDVRKRALHDMMARTFVIRS